MANRECRLLYPTRITAEVIVKVTSDARSRVRWNVCCAGIGPADELDPPS